MSIIYQQDNGETLTSLKRGAFDKLLCNMALMDMADIRSVFRSVWRVLKKGGHFVFSITHPAFQAPHSYWQHSENGTMNRIVSSYFKEGFWRSANPTGVRGQVGAHHRTLSTYINLLSDENFILERMIEPALAEGDFSQSNAGCAKIPAVLLIRARKVNQSHIG